MHQIFTPIDTTAKLNKCAQLRLLLESPQLDFIMEAHNGISARIVEEAPFVWIAHDVGPRAMSPKVKNVVQPRSWFIDIATMTMD